MLRQDLAPLFLCACTLQSLTFTGLAWCMLGAPQARSVSPCLDRCSVQPKAGVMVHEYEAPVKRAAPHSSWLPRLTWLLCFTHSVAESSPTGPPEPYTW